MLRSNCLTHSIWYFFLVWGFFRASRLYLGCEVGGLIEGLDLYLLMSKVVITSLWSLEVRVPAYDLALVSWCLFLFCMMI